MSEPTTQPTKTTALEPFGYWPASASKIFGLGGRVIDPDPTYAFHSNYAELGNGIVRCTVRFDRLEAELGSIIIRVNGLPPGPGAKAETIRTWPASLRNVASGEGVIEFSFQASTGSRYAVLGHIPEESDARATGLSLTMVTTLESEVDERRAATRKSVFGRRVFRRKTRMFDQSRPTFADPVSQACTASQFDDPAYRQWTREMRVEPRTHRKQWEQVYILKVLHRYGMLRPGARGLGIGLDAERLPAVLASHGCTIVATDLVGGPALPSPGPMAQIERLRFPEICADEVFDRQVGFGMLVPHHLDPTLTGFDFLWSTGAVSSGLSVDAGLALVRDSVACLTFGGLAVHCLDFDVSGAGGAEGDPIALRRADLERMAVDVVSRGHYVAQFKYDFGSASLDRQVDVPPYSDERHLKVKRGDQIVTSFGIIVRRGER